MSLLFTETARDDVAATCIPIQRIPIPLIGDGTSGGAHLRVLAVSLPSQSRFSSTPNPERLLIRVPSRLFIFVIDYFFIYCSHRTVIWEKRERNVGDHWKGMEKLHAATATTPSQNKGRFKPHMISVVFEEVLISGFLWLFDFVWFSYVFWRDSGLGFVCRR